MILMKTKKGRKFRWWMVGLPLALFAMCFIIALFIVEEPPLLQIEETRKILQDAEKLHADVYSRKEYREAKVLYDSAMSGWKQENEKFIVFRRFDNVVQLAEKSQKKGRQAIEKAKSSKKDVKNQLAELIDELRKEMKAFEKLFGTLPLATKIKNKYADGKLLLNEVEILFEQGNYDIGREKGREASRLIKAAYNDAQDKLRTYFVHLPQWKKELEDAIAFSKRHRCYVIVVEKIPPRCDLYYNGEKKYSFEVEFGKNWIGDKQREGDYATPEGSYKVTKKLQGGSTKYYKALLLNYPNDNDRARIAHLKKSGKIPRNAGLGSLIEIHGDGGKGGHWTNGCVALSNKDMDSLYKKADKGTMVVIIGASKPWEYLITR